MSKTCQLFSGSSGNSIFISNKNTKLLVDAGVSAKRIEEALKNIGEDAEELAAIFVTHEHIDHIRGVRVLASRYGIPVFADKRVMEKMVSSGDVNEKVCINDISDCMEIDGIEVLPFENSHDSTACFGYRFNLSGARSVSVCTDTGYITNDAKDALLGSSLVYLESNHEVSMLLNGPYPYPLKKRIISDKGHLSNEACSEFAKELIKNGTTRLVLSHLSRENNTPANARQTTLSALIDEGFEEGVDFRLRVSPIENCERPIVL